jgi:hypothetical protein
MTAAEERALLRSARKAVREADKKGWTFLRDARDIVKW